WGPLVAAVMVLGIDLLATGGMHLDALGDVADGVASRKPHGEAIAVMRDPAIGAVGAAALATALLMRFALVVLLVSEGSPLSLASVPVAGRFAMLWLMSRTSVTAGPSLATTLSSSATGPVGRAGGITALLLGWILAGLPGAAAIIMAGIVAEIAARWTRRRFGDVTGDAVGATGFVAELAALTLLPLWNV
ncbi:MAG: adenosylcobinamide-GDP ribazoletransferase, partial [Actinomycetota bacterium]